jgi:hypothetical protein
MRSTTIPLRDRNETRPQNARIGFDGDHDFRTVIEGSEVDFLIVSAELGFSPLGANHELISEALGIDSATIVELAQMVQEDPLCASMVCLKNRIPNGGGLRGVMLVSSENSRYYREQLAEAKNPNRIRDFYFALTHESLVLASNEVKATKFGMTHISAGGDIQPTILKHSIDAYIQFAYKSQARSRQFSFVGCCIDWSMVEQAASMADTEFRGPHLHAAYFENNDIDGFRRVTAKIL